MENRGRLEIRELLDLLDPKGSRVQSDLVAYLVKLERRVLEDLLVQLDQRVKSDLKESRAKLGPEAKLVKKAIGVSLELQEILERLAQPAQEV
jgi:cell division protein ZapA (FtsZ GTPase activity inhibitor)